MLEAFEPEVATLCHSPHLLLSLAVYPEQKCKNYPYSIMHAQKDQCGMPPGRAMAPTTFLGCPTQPLHLLEKTFMLCMLAPSARLHRHAPHTVIPCGPRTVVHIKGGHEDVRKIQLCSIWENYPLVTHSAPIQPWKALFEQKKCQKYRTCTLLKCTYLYRAVKFSTRKPQK